MAGRYTEIMSIGYALFPAKEIVHAIVHWV